MPHPWELGDEQQRWDGYLDPAHFDPEAGQNIMRNLVGATTYEGLREREDHAVGIRAMTLRAHGIPSSYDLDGLKQIHGHLFQDVYAWAGDVRTVDIAKGAPFAYPEDVLRMLSPVAKRIEQTDRLRNVPQSQVASELARIYNVTNQAHPFREGNGRTQREFVTALAAESGHDIDWTKVTGRTNDAASEAGRRGDPAPLSAMFQAITHETPRHRVSRVLDATRTATGRVIGRPTNDLETPPRAGRGRGRGPGPDRER